MSPRIDRSLSVCGVFLAGILFQMDAAGDEGPPVVYRTGNSFLHEIEQPFSGSWSSIELRQVLNHIAADRKISIVLDRRIDPSIELPIRVANGSLRTGLMAIARQAQGDAAVPENIVYLGPKSATKSLRTLIELRGQELRSNESGISKKRRVELLQHGTFQWKDLDSPREILENVAGHSQISVVNPQVIPYDLWASATLPSVTVVETLSVILIQFDLTFRWVEEGAGIELIPIPETVFLERKHSSKQKPADAVLLIRKHFPRIEAEVSNSTLMVKGLLEDHESISSLLRGEGATRPIKIEPPQPLRKQLFNLKAERVPIRTLMKTLEESAVSFEYDPAAMTAAGIDLDMPITIDVNKASADEFFKSIFDPAGIEIQIEELTVKLTPKQKS